MCINHFDELLSIYTVKENTEALVVASKEIGLEINSDKTKYIVMSRNQNARQSHSIKVDNSSLKGWKISNIWEQPLRIKIQMW